MKAKLLIYITTVLLFSTTLTAQNDCPPVVKLKQLYKEDKNFRQTIHSMFKNVKDLKGGAPNPWKGKDIEDLYSFLNEWFYFLPTTENGLDRIIEFSFLYYDNPNGMKFVLEEPGRGWTLEFIEERGKYMDSPASAVVIADWMSNKSLKHEDFVYPEGGFSSFNEFFIRDLKPGARTVDAVSDPSVIVSPADGIINMVVNDLELDTQIPTKGNMTMSLNALLGNSPYAKHFIGGKSVAVFLLPTNYHHYHAPVEGVVVESSDSVGDRLFGMPDILDMINEGNPGYGKDYSVFENFKHGYLIFKTRNYGYVGMVPIGLQTIGSVVFEERFKRVTNDKPQQVYKGEKIGHFAYGGSTVLLIFEKGRFGAVGVNQGQQIGRLK